MNKEFALIVFKRFAKGFIAGAGSFIILYLIQAIPLFQANLSEIFTDKTALILATAFFLALEKWLQGYKPQ